MKLRPTQTSIMDFKNMLQKSGAEVLCDCLKRQGVKFVFGIPGTHNVDLFEALRRSEIQVVAATHEQGTAFMANGYSRVTGETGVFLTIPGPGFTNAFTGIAESLSDSCPVVGILAGVRSNTDRAFQLHEIQQIELARPITKGVYTVRKPDEIFEKIKKVFQTAESGEPGPVILEVPSNVLSERVGLSRSDEGEERESYSSQDFDREFTQAIDFINRSKRIGMFVGLGAANAAEQVKEVAEWLTAPVATTLSGRGCLSEDHPLSLGFGWTKNGTESVNLIFDTCDLILAIGAKFSQIGTQDFHLRFTSPLIHVDTSKDVPGKNYPAVLTLQMNAKEFLDKLLMRKEHLGRGEDKEVLEFIEHQRRTQLSLIEKGDRDPVRFSLGGYSCSPYNFFSTLREVLPDDAILVTDSGYHQIWARENFRVLKPRTFITPSDYQSMGYAIPSAIGAAISLPHKKVVAVVGDGGFLMSGFEPMTAVRERIDLLIVLFNDGYFGIIKEIQESKFGATCGAELAVPNLKKLAESLRVHYQVSVGDIGTTLRDCIQRKGLRLLEVKVTYEEKPLTSRIKRQLRRRKGDLKQLARKAMRI